MHLSSSVRPARIILATIAAAAAFAALAGSAGAISIEQGAPAPTLALGTIATNGTVHAVAVKGDTAYLGGDFTVVGTPSGSAVSLDPTTAAQAGTWPAVNGSVSASVADGAGGWYIGGDFTVVGGLRRTNLAHITPAGAVDSAFDVPVDSTVYALYLSGSTLYLGGNFSSVNSTSRSNAAAVNATTGALLGFAPEPNNQVSAITGNGTDIYLGGYFTTLTGAVTRNRLAAVDPTTGVPTSWNPDLNNGVEALVLSGTTIYAGGHFTSVNQGTTPVTRNRLAAFSTTTGTATSWNPDVSGAVYSLVLSGSTVYAGGSFTSVNQGTTPATRSRLGAFDASGVVTSFNPSLNSTVQGLGLSGTTLYATGDFTTVNGGAARRYAAAFDTTLPTGNVVSWNPSPAANGRTIAVGGGRVLLGGYFKLLGGSTRNYVAAIDVTTGALTSFDPNLDAAVRALAVGSSTLYLGGDFEGVNGGTARNFLAEVSLATGTATSFDPSPDDVVYALQLVGSTLYAGGYFTTVNGSTTRNRLAGFATSTGTATPFNPNVAGSVEAIVVNGTTLYAGGDFTTVNGGTTRNRVAAFDTGTSAATTFDPNIGGSVYALALTADGSTLYAGGYFTTVNGATSRQHSAAFSTAVATGNALAFNPRPNDTVRALAISGANVYLGGSMISTLSPSVSHVNALLANGTTGVVDAWDPLLHAPQDATVYGIAPLANGNVLLVGDMDSAGTAAVGGVAIVGTPAAAAPAASATPPVSSAVALPNTPVTVATSKTGDASKPTVSLTAPAGAFNNQIGVTVGMTLVTSTLRTPGGFKAVGTTVSVVVTGSTPDRITTFAKPIEIIYYAPESDSAPQYSADGITWVAIPQLAAGTTTLPAGARDGWYKDAAGAIHVLTLHATYFALLQGGPSSAGPAKSTALSLTFGMKRTVKRIAGGVTVFFQPTKAVAATAVLSQKGKTVASAKGSVVALGAGKLRLAFPKGLAKGAYRVTLTALAGSEKVLRSMPLTVG